MTIQILDVVGIDHALTALQKSYSQTGKTLDWLIEKTILQRENKYRDSEMKHLRFIQAYLDIKAPRYWWQEFVTYRHGVEMYSESTIHTLTRKKLSLLDFAENEINEDILKPIIDRINYYINNKDLLQAKSLLPESFLQSRAVMASYQALANMYKDRKNHKLPEWKEFCIKLKDFPYSQLIL